MRNIGMQRMRLQSHRKIKRLLEYHEQQYLLHSGRIDRQATCRYNAHSAFLRCAVNPTGDCLTCDDYESILENDEAGPCTTY
ncbi:MAG: DUF6464 family protein [Microcoleaceae cyanobacterium]